jgi:hypothetical protein
MPNPEKYDGIKWHVGWVWNFVLFSWYRSYLKLGRKDMIIIFK